VFMKMQKDLLGRKGPACRITQVGVTTDTLTSRAGLCLFARYVAGIGLRPMLVRWFGGMRKSRKGQPIDRIVTQVLCFFVDGMSRHLVQFDRLHADPGYAQVVGCAPTASLSSHAIKRFFRAFSLPLLWRVRRLLQDLFLWRLRLTQPRLIALGIDTMVLDNHEAHVRHGVQPTYKQVQGFQPLQMTWGRFLVDAVFRGGNKHSNHGDTVAQMVQHMVHRIRTEYRADVAIVCKLDSGFFDQRLCEVFEDLQVGYVVGGKLYADLHATVKALPRRVWRVYQTATQAWEYVDFRDRRGTWARSRRAIFCSPRQAGAQVLLAFARPDTILYTNLGVGEAIDDQLAAAGAAEMQTAPGVMHTEEGELMSGELGLVTGLLLAIGGVVAVVFGARFLVDGGSGLATDLGISEAVIGLTVVAVGTSLPELATSAISALRGKSDLALGNIIGSNIVNLLGILGVSALVQPFSVLVERPAATSILGTNVDPQGGVALPILSWQDMGALFLSVFLLILFGLTGRKIARWEGAVLLGAYLLYMGLLAGVVPTPFAVAGE